MLYGLKHAAAPTVGSSTIYSWQNISSHIYGDAYCRLMVVVMVMVMIMAMAMTGSNSYYTGRSMHMTRLIVCFD